MAIIKTIDDFNELTSNITSFSHAYLFSTNSLSTAYPYALEFAKKIIHSDEMSDSEYLDICYKIDKGEFEDIYVVNPDTIGINTIEIEKLFNYMETKSLRKNGSRIYIIYGFERLSQSTSNKILKFLEEPSENVYALLITENVDKILSTIISRCQIINLTFDSEKMEKECILNMQKFLNDLDKYKNSTIAYVYKYFSNAFGDRTIFYENMECIEIILKNIINKRYGLLFDSDYYCNTFDEYPNYVILNILNITNRLKSLIMQNINLNLLLDRYIIEVSKELKLCQK